MKNHISQVRNMITFSVYFTMIHSSFVSLVIVPLLPNGTGEAQASAVFNLLAEWNIAGRVRSMSFDTTSSNTGLQTGACVLLEQKLKMSLLNLACRHHMHELIVGRVFDHLMAKSSGPSI